MTETTAQIEIEDQLAIVTLKTLNVLYSEENGADCVALYFFYYKTAKQQKTNQVWATKEYCKEKLHWGFDRYKAALDVLKKYDLVEIIKGVEVNDKWYVKIKYLRSTKPQIEEVSEPTSSKRSQIEEVSEPTPNALSNINNINALSNINKYSLLEDLTEIDFQEIADHYRVPISFVLSKYEDIQLWVGQQTKLSKTKGRNWRLTLMNWVKRDAIKISERSFGDPTKRNINASEL